MSTNDSDLHWLEIRDRYTRVCVSTQGCDEIAESLPELVGKLFRHMEIDDPAVMVAMIVDECMGRPKSSKRMSKIDRLSMTMWRAASDILKEIREQEKQQEKLLEEVLDRHEKEAEARRREQQEALRMQRQEEDEQRRAKDRQRLSEEIRRRRDAAMEIRRQYWIGEGFDEELTSIMAPRVPDRNVLRSMTASQVMQIRGMTDEHIASIVRYLESHGASLMNSEKLPVTSSWNSTALPE